MLGADCQNAFQDQLAHCVKGANNASSLSAIHVGRRQEKANGAIKSEISLTLDAEVISGYCNVCRGNEDHKKVKALERRGTGI